MAEVDTSSYPKPVAPANPLDIAAKVGALRQQQLSISQAQLDQANQGLQYMSRAMGALGPNASKEDYIQAAQTAVQMGLVPAQALNTFKQRAMAAPSSKAFYDEFMTTAADHQQQINYHLGQNKDVNDQGVMRQGVQLPVSQGGGFRPSTVVPVQNPPGTEFYDENNQARKLPAAAPSGVYRDTGPLVPNANRGSLNPDTPAATTVAPRPGGTPIVPRRMPVDRISGPTGPTTQTGYDFAQRFAGDGGAALKAGPSPLFEEGKKAYSVSQLNASSRAQSIKPAIQALKLMPGLATGPGTAQYNDFIAGLKAWGITDTKIDNDPTVARQELEKKLAQYVGSSPLGQRSDAQQALAEAGSPNPKKQILPALQNLTRDAIALDRVQILKPNAFKGTDYQNYIKHEGSFPQSVDEKALTLDLLPEKDRGALITKMATQYKKGNASEKQIANKFLETLKLAKEHGIYEGM
jgi:hypothetical protein